MVHANQGQPGTESESLGCVQTNDQRSSQARTTRGSDSIQVPNRHVRLGESLFHHRHNGKDVLA